MNSKLFILYNIDQSLEDLKQKRSEMEGMREEMIKYLKQLHNKITLARKEGIFIKLHCYN